MEETWYLVISQTTEQANDDVQDSGKCGRGPNSLVDRHLQVVNTRRVTSYERLRELTSRRFSFNHDGTITMNLQTMRHHRAFSRTFSIPVIKDDTSKHVPTSRRSYWTFSSRSSSSHSIFDPFVHSLCIHNILSFSPHSFLSNSHLSLKYPVAKKTLPPCFLPLLYSSTLPVAVAERRHSPQHQPLLPRRINIAESRGRRRR